jgi:uncharacterized protein (DUF1501 family)
MLSRRKLFVASGVGLLGAISGSALAQVGLNPTKGAGPRGDIVVNVFLRGGLDGLSAVAPYQEANYYDARPSTAIAAPDSTKANARDRLLRLDDQFGLHPALAALYPLYESKQLGLVTAAGSGDRTRSHFEAMSLMERGTGNAGDAGSNGWMARLLAARETTGSPLRAVAFATTMPDTLRGATDALALESLAQFKLDGDAQAIRAMYSTGGDVLTTSGRETLRVLESLESTDSAKFRPQNGAVYPDTELGRGLQQTATLIRSEIGLELAFLERSGWDTHVAQGGSTGLLATMLTDVAQSLAAFSQDLGTEMTRVSVVVQTEFGRRVAENAGLGTDHGRASVMFLMGGGFVGGKVHGTFPGLSKEILEGPGDVPVTTDYRQVWSEVLTKRVPGVDPVRVFGPDIGPAIGVCQGSI